jgi:hypothetical protein
MGADALAGRRVGDLASLADDREPVLLARRGARLGVQRVPAVPAQVGLLRASHDKDMQAVGAEHRAHRVHPGAAVRAHGREERQADVDLIELSAARRGQGGLLVFELGPRGHCRDVTRVSLTPWVSDSVVGCQHAS